MSADPTAHLTDDTLRWYRTGRLGTDVVAAATDHLERCPACHDRLVRLNGPPAPPDDLPAELNALDGYADFRELGRGGMGVVYLARNRQLDRPEVLKLIQPAQLARPGSRERFLSEARAAARLTHPHVAAVYAVRPAADGLVICMEYVPGESLDKPLRAGPLPVRKAAGYACHAALGLHHAHARGLVHRDVKPHNLMLTRADGREAVKVIDFGVAKAVTDPATDAVRTAAGAVLGTTAYMAPEQACDAARVDGRADVYALGCTLFHMLTGRPPFVAEVPWGMLLAHREQPPPDAAAARPEVPAELAAVVRRMMAKNPDDRFPTAAAVAEALKPFVKKPAAPPPLPVARRVAPPPPPADDWAVLAAELRNPAGMDPGVYALRRDQLVRQLRAVLLDDLTSVPARRLYLEFRTPAWADRDERYGEELITNPFATRATRDKAAARCRKYGPLPADAVRLGEYELEARFLKPDTRR